MQMAMELWTATRLLMKGWEISGDDRLGMTLVKDMRSPLHGTVPAPRVLQNQLDSNLESYIMRRERDLLRAVQNAMLKQRSSSWVVISLVVVVFLHVLERDIWRLMYWKYHREDVSAQPYYKTGLLMAVSATCGATHRAQMS